MGAHYSQPKGFVGRNICYSITYDDIFYGYIVGGSATRFLPGRRDFFGEFSLNCIVNNIFYHVEKVNSTYPTRNFTSKILSSWRTLVINDWREKYDDIVTGFESLVELPRTGELYKKDGWTLVGQTIGYTCKRVAGKGTDNWSGKRVWNTKNLRPKLVFCRRVD